MLAPSGELLRAGLGLKVNQVKRAARSYLRDRAHQATNTATSYAVAAGLFATSAIFLIAACLVGITALFRWIEIEYGLFQAFGAVGALLLALAAICAGLAAIRLKRPGPRFPSLTSRLRVAITANPIKSLATDDAHAERVPLAPAAPGESFERKPAKGAGLPAGLAIAAVLLGWAAARRRQLARQARRTDG